MRSRLGFGLSLLAALGIHAVILLVPRAAFVENVRIPTVELELTEIAGPPVPAAPLAPIATRPIAARAPSQVEAPRQPETHAPATAVEPSGKEPPPAAPVGQAEAPAGDQPVPGAQSEPLTAGVSGGPESAGTRASPSNGSGPASGAQVGATNSSTPVAVPAFIPPRPLSEILPKYPLSARRSGFEGVVKVSVQVNAGGTVTGVAVLASSGHPSLDQAVLDAYRHALFAPALQDGKPVAGRLVIPVRFRLEGGQN